MERLEAALEKARQSRQTLKVAPVPSPAAESIAITEPVEKVVGPTELWANLEEFKISKMQARKQRITALNSDKHAGPYDLLRSRTILQMRENNWHSLAITSPNKSCGKTTVCSNLALSMARQTDLKILVFDLDLRRPTLHKVLGYRPSSSFHEVLEGRVSAKDQLVRFGENLAFGLNNKPATAPSELLQSKQTKACLIAIKEEFQPDLILFDMPPMLATDDNVGFLPGVDCGLLVSAAESTTIAQLDVCEKELSELTNVLGVVLNKCRFASGSHGYDYDY
ncbi:MAG: CpsD/CapB family tyrosine-protein kinase [Paracoccaceae bacterium]